MYRQIENLARQAGKIMLDAYGKVETAQEKTSNSDIVTEYDIRIQTFLFNELSELFPDAEFLGEEGDNTKSKEEIFKGKTFIIDPIDGTTNFVRNFRKSAVSIALWDTNEIVYGCCYIPYCDEMYTATKGGGAYCNGKRIFCADRSIEHSVCSVGTTPYNKDLMGDATFAVMRAIFDASMDIRRFGSAVIDLLDVACGRCDMFCEMRLSPWDYAAAGFIAKCAGAIVTDMNGAELKFDDRYSLIAASRPCYDFFMNCESIQKYKQLF